MIENKGLYKSLVQNSCEAYRSENETIREKAARSIPLYMCTACVNLQQNLILYCFSKQFYFLFFKQYIDQINTGSVLDPLSAIGTFRE